MLDVVDKHTSMSPTNQKNKTQIADISDGAVGYNGASNSNKHKLDADMPIPRIKMAQTV